MQTVNTSRKRYRFIDTETFSPTLHLLEQFMQTAGMKRTRWGWRAHFSERNLQFSDSVCECLEYKHLLAQLLIKHCPNVVPETYLLDDYTWTTVLNEIAEKHYLVKQSLLDEVPDLVWILKPALLNNGQHIKLFQTLSQIEEHMLHPNRLGGPHVLQRYITHPDLYDKRKYSLRFFVVITQEAGAFLYQQGYLNVALAPYSNKNFDNLSTHLTNEHLQQDVISIEQIPTQDQAKAKLWYPQVRSIVKQVDQAIHASFPSAFLPQKERTFAIFGFDFIMDDQGKIWLLEINHGPCFPIEPEHPLQTILYRPFWQSMINQFVIPIMNSQSMPQHGKFGFEAIRSSREEVALA